MVEASPDFDVILAVGSQHVVAFKAGVKRRRNQQVPPPGQLHPGTHRPRVHVRTRQYFHHFVVHAAASVKIGLEEEIPAC